MEESLEQFRFREAIKRGMDLARLGNPALVQRLSNTVNWRGRRWKDALWLVILATLLVALARPQWGSVTEMVEQEGIEVRIRKMA